MNLVLLGIGGAFGAISRYKLGCIFNKYEKNGFPFGIFLINISGSLLLGIICGLGFTGNPYLLLGDGFCGAFTTFSTFTSKSVDLIKQKEIKKSVIFILMTITIGIFCFVTGFSAVKMLF